MLGVLEEGTTQEKLLNAFRMVSTLKVKKYKLYLQL